MLPGRFNFGDPDESPPQEKRGWLARPLTLAIAIVLAALAQILDLGRFLR